MYEGDEIDLLYVLRPHGWSDVLLYVGGRVLQFSLTHVFSDPTADLIRLAIDLYKREKSVELLLWDEPGGHSLRFEQTADRCDKYAVRLCRFPEGPPEPRSRTETVVVEFRVKADHFAKLIHSELEKVAKLLEEKSYRQHRDFPYAELSRLCGYVQTRHSE